MASKHHIENYFILCFLFIFASSFTIGIDPSSGSEIYKFIDPILSQILASTLKDSSNQFKFLQRMLIPNH